MRNITLIDPSQARVGRITESELAAFLLERGLVAKRSGIRDQLIVFDACYAALVEAQPSDQLVVVKAFDQFRARTQEVLATKATLLLEPSRRNLRHVVFTIPSFIGHMNRFVDNLDNAAVALPPGVYGQDRVLFAIKAARRCPPAH